MFGTLTPVTHVSSYDRCIASACRFGTLDGACSGLALPAATVRGANGNPTSETVSGGNVAAGTATPSALADALWPGPAGERPLPRGDGRPLRPA